MLVHKLHSTKRGATFLAVAGFVFPMHSAFACVSEEGSFNPPMFIIAFAIMVMLVSVLTFVAWAIRKKFFPNYSLFSPIIVATGLLAILLGIGDLFVIPEFESIIVGFGADLPIPTRVLFGVRHLLWLPTLLIIGLWHASKTWRNRTRYFAAALFTEIILLLLVLSALYSPIFKLGCA